MAPAEKHQAFARWRCVKLLHIGLVATYAEACSIADPKLAPVGSFYTERMASPTYKALGRMMRLSTRDSRKCASQPTLRAIAKPAVK